MERTANCLRKLERMNKALRHEEPDRVPISDFFWGSFLERWREDLGLPADTDIYTYYDLDWMVTIPNMDPHMKDFEVIRDKDDLPEGARQIVNIGFVNSDLRDGLASFISGLKEGLPDEVVREQLDSYLVQNMAAKNDCNISIEDLKGLKGKKGSRRVNRKKNRIPYSIFQSAI